MADEYVKAGYGQIDSGYIDYAKRSSEIQYDPDQTEPNQKWHILVSYYDYKKNKCGFNMDSRAALSGMKCPQLML